MTRNPGDEKYRLPSTDSLHHKNDNLPDTNPQHMDFLKDLWYFMKERKKFWLLPVIVVLLVLGLLIVVGGSSALAPFIYSLF